MESFTYSDLKVGMTASFKKEITHKDILDFSGITGDKNPLHLDEAYSKETSYKRPVVFGLLVNSLLSTLAGMHLPGKYSLIVYVESYFRNPCFEGDVLDVFGEIENKIDSTNVIIIKTKITNQGSDLIMNGRLFVKVLK